jgi:hypothetical protein
MINFVIIRFERVSILQQTGVVNREELHNVDAEAIARSDQLPDTGFLRIGQWVWNHDPEAYARGNYGVCLAHIKNNEPFKNTNIPPGHIYRPWTLRSEIQRQKDGIPSNLKRNGDWSG